jgi:hypothetical protein
VSDRRGQLPHFPLTADLSAVLATAHQQRADTTGAPFARAGVRVRAMMMRLQVAARRLTFRIDLPRLGDGTAL